MKTQKSTSIILLAGLIIAITAVAWRIPFNSELTNTKWKGVMNIPDPQQGTLNFKNDTLLAIVNNQIIETGSYQVKGDTLILKKISGTSPCSSIEIGYYNYVINADKLFITVIKDDCNARITVLSTDGYQKTK